MSHEDRDAQPSQSFGDRAGPPIRALHPVAEIDRTSAMPPMPVPPMPIRWIRPTRRMRSLPAFLLGREAQPGDRFAASVSPGPRGFGLFDQSRRFARSARRFICKVLRAEGARRPSVPAATSQPAAGPGDRRPRWERHQRAGTLAAASSATVSARHGQPPDPLHRPRHVVDEGPYWPRYRARDRRAVAHLAGAGLVQDLRSLTRRQPASVGSSRFSAAEPRCRRKPAVAAVRCVRRRSRGGGSAAMSARTGLPTCTARRTAGKRPEASATRAPRGPASGWSGRRRHSVVDHQRNAGQPCSDTAGQNEAAQPSTTGTPPVRAPAPARAA